MKKLTTFAAALVSLYASAVTPPKPNCPLDKLVPPGFPALATEEERDLVKRNSVAKAVREKIPGGVEMPPDDEAALAATQGAIASGAKVIYGAAFKSGDDIQRFDVLSRSGVGVPWDVTLVSASTTVKPDSKVGSMARRKLRLEAAGQKAGTLTLLHLNEAYRIGGRPGLFRTANLTEKVAAAVAGKTLKDFERADAETTEKTDIPELSVLHVPWIPYQRRNELLAAGITDFRAVLAKLDKLDLTEPVTPEQIDLVKHAIVGKQYLNRPLMKEELSKWDLVNPLIYLDFETIDYPIPVYENTKPNQQVPFQFSVQIGGKHFEHLHETSADPRPGVIQALLRSIPKQGSIVAYNKSFEAGRLKELAEAYPEHAADLLQMAERLVDPWPVLKKTYFDKGLKGSYSLKSVAPTILGQHSSYKGMAVADGLMAQAGFEALAYGKLTDGERTQLRRAMLDYCEKDTAEAAAVVEWMIKTSGARP